MRLLQKALTFDDVLLVPAHSQVLPRDVSLATRLTRNITLNLPLLSAAMDTVTEGRLAIALAQEGGIGIIHKNLTAKAQAAEVAKVKRFESGILRDPITVSPLMTVRDVIEITRQHRISGLPVIDKAGKVVGIVTNRDLRFETNLDQPVKLRNFINFSRRSGALGVKLLGGHFPLTPEASHRMVETADDSHCYMAWHVGTTEKGSDIEGLLDINLLSLECILVLF
jgi:IMP dehydrogenase/GMP reductase